MKNKLQDFLVIWRGGFEEVVRAQDVYELRYKRMNKRTSRNWGTIYWIDSDGDVIMLQRDDWETGEWTTGDAIDDSKANQEHIMDRDDFEFYVQRIKERKEKYNF